MALLFDDAAEKVAVSNHASIQSLDSLTLMAWYMVVDITAGTANPLINKNVSVGWGLFRPGLGVGPDDWRWVHQRATVDSDRSTTGNIIQTNRWEWFCAMDSNGAQVQFLHGALGARATEPSYATIPSTPSGAGADDSAQSITIGQDGADTQTAQARIAFVAIFNRRLPIPEALDWQYLSGRIAAGDWQFRKDAPRDMRSGLVGLWLPGLYGATIVPDLSGRGNHGLITGATVDTHLPLPSFSRVKAV